MVQLVEWMSGWYGGIYEPPRLTNIFHQTKIILMVGMSSLLLHTTHLLISVVIINQIKISLDILLPSGQPSCGPLWFSIFLLLMRCPSIGVGMGGFWLSLSSEVLLRYLGQWVTVWALSPVALHLQLFTSKTEGWPGSINLPTWDKHILGGSDTGPNRPWPWWRDCSTAPQTPRYSCRTCNTPDFSATRHWRISGWQPSSNWWSRETEVSSGTLGQLRSSHWQSVQLQSS